MKNATMPEFNTSTEAVDFFNNAFYGDAVMIKGDQFKVTELNYDHIILTRIDGKKYRYDFGY